MVIIDSIDLLDELIKKSEITLVYFGGKRCSVCSAVKPKIEEILLNYPKIKSAEVDVEEALVIAGRYNVFTIPVIMVFIQGKEAIREARYFSMGDIENKIDRYYHLLF